ncbi:glycosyl hydrolase [Holotrichia oblita]|nr:glycosyl hydrolase [Holotrichia oblita]
MLGAATAAHQVEGNNINSDCWVMEQLPHSSYDEPSLDAVDHYNRYEEDIKLMADAGLNTYRFSVEWARIQPTKDSWEASEIEHYRNVLKFCHKTGIKPIVTMHHFSSPKWLITEGGWESPKVVEYFADYCARAACELGDLMEYVFTINEANMRLQLASLIKDMKNRMKRTESDVQVGVNLMRENMQKAAMEAAQAFGVDDPGKVCNFVSLCTPEGDLLVMKAHEAARDAMKKECPHLKIGLTLSLHDMQWIPDGEENAKKEWDDEFTHYLPYIQKDDFLGAQCYTRKCYGPDGTVQSATNTSYTQMGYEDYPQAIGNVVRAAARDFKGDIIVTENGIATDNDNRRAEFINEALESIQACIMDGIPVKGYMYWSLLDNFEWQKGYSKTFGLIAVDRATQKRYPKGSLKALGAWAEQ